MQIKGWKTWRPALLGGALLGCGRTLIDAAPRIQDVGLMMLASFVGMGMLVVGGWQLWVSWKYTRDEAAEDAKPPSILPDEPKSR